MAMIAIPIGQLYLTMVSPFSIAHAASLCPTGMLRLTVSATPSSVTVSPALSGRSATATLSGGESRITALSWRSARSVSSELAILVVRSDRVHAADQRATHVALG